MVPGIFITALVLWSFVDTNQPVILCSIAQVDANKLGSDGGGDGFYLHTGLLCSSDRVATGGLTGPRRPPTTALGAALHNLTN